MNGIRQRRGAGAAFIASGAVFFVAEFIAAAAWTDPPYSYTHHFISNLGVRGPLTAFGQYIYSPLAPVMNTGVFLVGLAALAGVALLRGLPGGRRVALIVTAAVLAAGMILVALFPGTGDDGTGDYHGMGAALAFVSGNVLSILLGGARRFLGVPAGTGRALVLSGVLGLISVVAFGAILASDAGVLIGLAERGIVYPFLLGFILLGATILTRGRSGRAAEATRG
ncbi:putative membrane protein [Catenuloplanes nepalensis]|uniref:Membrane protein n=1 Tax=Catenuloplanes nepalensis TaxID=587533 RepID=A0ABT9MPP8_9ACTN|nr:DUF998 domain-containing protein [Catenuloplanes nepalensis]MDP9793291.1 putative membrane protein [Catenuloplanes nepalensis]